MKRNIIILLIISCFHPGITSGQLAIKNKSSAQFLLDGLHMTLSNNFLQSDAYEYITNYASLPFKGEYFRVYGSHLILSVFEQDSLVSLGPFSSSFFLRDTAIQDKGLFKLDEIEARVVKNETLMRDWQLINTMPSFKDSSVAFKANPKTFKTAYWIMNDSLQIGDSVSIEFRRWKSTTFLKIHANRKDAYIRPYLMATSATPDSLRTESEFIKYQLMHRDVKGTFYDD